jgi:hypothetical protein
MTEYQQPSCASCRSFRSLLGGSTGICFEQWKHVGPYDAVPLTTAGESCDKHRAFGEQAGEKQPTDT